MNNLLCFLQLRKTLDDFFSSNLVKLDLDLDLDLDPDPDPHSEKLLDPDPHKVNADPQPWFYLLWKQKEKIFFVAEVGKIYHFFFNFSSPPMFIFGRWNGGGGLAYLPPHPTTLRTLVPPATLFSGRSIIALFTNPCCTTDPKRVD